MPIATCGNGVVGPGEQCEDSVTSTATCPVCVDCRCLFFARPNFDALWTFIPSGAYENSCYTYDDFRRVTWPRPWHTNFLIAQDRDYVVTFVVWPPELSALDDVPIEGFVNADYETYPRASMSSEEIVPAPGTTLFNQLTAWLKMNPTGHAARALKVKITLDLDGTGTNTTATGPIRSSNIADLALSISSCRIAWQDLFDPAP